MNSDSFFTIGKTHRVCQDYARHGMVDDCQKWPDPHPYAIVCDGCSSCPDTDVGARMLALSAEFDFISDDGFDYSRVLRRAREFLHPMLSPCSLSATLLTACVRGSRVTVDAAGDGTVVLKLRNGTVLVYDIDHNGAPKYLSYRLEEDGDRRYRDMFPGPRFVHMFADGQRTGICATNSCEIHSWTWPVTDVELVMVMTDGVSSFVDADFKRVPVPDVVSKLTDIKNYNGDFVERRLKFFLNKEVTKLGWIHSDDIGVAAIHIPTPKADT